MEMMIVVVIIGLIAAIGVPVFLNSVSNAREHAKEVNIARVEAAKEQWALENSKTNGMTVQWSDISNYMGSTTSFTNLTINGTTITINKIGTSACY